MSFLLGSSYPSPEQYPHAPRNLFRSPGTVAQALGQNFGLLPFQTRFMENKHEESLKWSCTLTVNVPCGIGVRKVVGQHNRKKAAKNNAWVRLVRLLHSNGDLSKLFPSPESLVEQSNPQHTPPEDAIIEIYNYVACYGLTPQYRACVSNQSQGHPTTNVEIVLSQWEIKASGEAPDVKSAEISAVSKFKAQAEIYLQNHDPVPISTYKITTHNAKRIVDMYKSLHTVANVRIEVREVQLNGIQWQARLCIDHQVIGQGLPREDKQQAEKLMHLSAAMRLVQEDPVLLDNFEQTLQKEKSPAIPQMRSIRVPIGLESELMMLDSMEALIKAGLPYASEELAAESDYEDQNVRRNRRLEAGAAQQRSEELLKKAKKKSEAGAKSQLPINAHRLEIVKMVTDNLYSIVVGSTGSGKTTQVPQLLLNDASLRGVGAHCNILCTQPRRIAATSVARRVAAELGEHVGETVGYHVRFDARYPKTGGSILYTTTGILLEQLKHAPEDVMNKATHIIVDEVHERDMLIDFLMINLRSITRARRKARQRVPRIVLMSATLDTQLFANYFTEHGLDGAVKPCPSISVPGRLFPVKEYYLTDILHNINQTYPGKVDNLLNYTTATRSDMAWYLKTERALASNNNCGTAGVSTGASGIDWKAGARDYDEREEDVTLEREESFIPLDLVSATIGHICKTSGGGAILVFLPGLDELVKTKAALLERSIYGLNFADASEFRIHMLHSSVPHEAQEEVFASVPHGCRKIILSTNIAETSVTIPDVRFVVDTGKLRETRYDQVRRITRLQTVWVSKSNIRQRGGRAGRVQDGNYYGLFSRERYDSLKAAGLPELLRSDLLETCLSVKAQRFSESVGNFLAQAIEPPSPSAVRAAISELKALEALTSDEQLTDLGRLLSRLPVHPSLGKMIVLGIVFRCLDPMLLLSAASEEKSIFTRPVEERAQANEARKSFSGFSSDQISFLRAFNEMRHHRDTQGSSAFQAYARRKYLHVGAFRNIERCAQQIEAILIEAHLAPNRSARATPRAKLNGFGGRDLNINSENLTIVRALLVAGFHPNLSAKTNAGKAAFRTPNEPTVFVHPSSLNRIKKKDAYDVGTLFTYSKLAKSGDGNAIFFRDSTKVTPLLAVLFGGHVRLVGNVLTIDDWLSFRVTSEDEDARAAKVILEYRKARDRLLNIAFRSLTQGYGESDQPYLADIPLVDMFAKGMVDLLDLENSGDQFLLAE